MSTAFDMLKRAERPLSTNEMRTMLGKSKTATHRLLNEALACGLLTKNKIGKTIYWEIAS